MSRRRSNNSQSNPSTLAKKKSSFFSANAGFFAVLIAFTSGAFGVGKYYGETNTKLSCQDEIFEYREHILSLKQIHEKEIHDKNIEIDRLSLENIKLRQSITSSNKLNNEN